eukprot:3058618-Alexandrium_andersonii.AAC.1
MQRRSLESSGALQSRLEPLEALSGDPESFEALWIVLEPSECFWSRPPKPSQVLQSASELSPD